MDQAMSEADILFYFLALTRRDFPMKPASFAPSTRFLSARTAVSTRVDSG
jgi:hypothetical protein